MTSFASALTALQVEPPVRDALSMAADVAVIVVAAAVVFVALVLGRLMLRADRTMAELRRGLRQSFGPVSDRARSITDNVDFITHALRTDVAQLHASLSSVSERLQQASDRMEERIEDFNALMEVVQSEAEGIFLDTAATVRGVREGARSIGRGAGPRRASPDHAALVEADEASAEGPDPNDPSLADPRQADALAAGEP